MKYHPEVEPYINSTSKLDTQVGELLSLWAPEGLIDLNRGREILAAAAVLSPNILRLDLYIPHSFEVSRRCEEFGRQIGENYPILENLIQPDQMAFAGLTEDFMYILGGDGSNNSNGRPSNPVHEILTYLQLTHLGFQDLADGMALHFVAPQVLLAEKQEGRFISLNYTDKPSPMLDILTGIDALCKHYWMPPEHDGQLLEALEARIDDVIKRRNDSNHPLIKGLSNGGRERLREMISRIEKLMEGSLTEDEVREIYDI